MRMTISNILVFWIKTSPPRSRKLSGLTRRTTVSSGSEIRFGEVEVGNNLRLRLGEVPKTSKRPWKT